MKIKKLTMKQAKQIVETNGATEAPGIYGKCSKYFQSQKYRNTGLTKKDIVRDVWIHGQQVN